MFDKFKKHLLPASNDPGTEPPPALSRNIISYIGWIVTIFVSALLAIFVLLDFLYHHKEPYTALVIYMILPGFLMGGVAIILFGVAREWWRRHHHDPSHYPVLPTIDLNQPWQRRRIIFGATLIGVLVATSVVGVYRSYHFTESPEFCGLICHQVMKPEYTSYQVSPHARVGCAECHIGSGADWYVKSKMSGLRQVWAVVTNTYHTPIAVPVKNLRPAQETCEQCHWPEKFMNSVEKTIWHFSPDRVNTPVRYNLLLKIGGGAKELGLGRGIHWHISHKVKVRYWAADEQRQQIPWVEVTDEGQAPRIYRSPDCPETLPADAEIRTMDCLDCHNRPSHVYRSPRQLIDNYMATGALDRSLPYYKRYATELLEQQWASTPAALAGIENGLKTRYAQWMQGAAGQALVQSNIELLQKLYQTNFFPEQGVDWRHYPDDRGHFEYPGCYRCHDEKHRSADKRTISNDCTLCHQLLDQEEGQAAFGPILYKGGDFQHPRNLGEIWKDKNCTDCHGVALSKPPAKQTASAGQPG